MSVEDFLSALADPGDPDAAWRPRAVCRGMAVELFFPGRGDTATLEAARAVCASCPVRDACAAFGLSQNFGVWGGLSERERRRVRRQRAASRASGAAAEVA